MYWMGWVRLCEQHYSKTRHWFNAFADNAMIFTIIEVKFMSQTLLHILSMISGYNRKVRVEKENIEYCDKTKRWHISFYLLQETFLKTSNSVWEKLLVSTATREDKAFLSASAKLLVWQKKCKCIRDSVKCNSRCHKNRSCQNHDNALIK